MPVQFNQTLFDELIKSTSLKTCQNLQAGPCKYSWDQGFAYHPHFRGCEDAMILLPGFGLLPRWLLAVAYLMFMFFLFFGSALAADIFTTAVTVIVEQTVAVSVRTKSGRRARVRVKLWNPAVAAFMLFAVATSSPAILLSISATVTKLGQPGEELAPAVLVGSTAYNLMGIVAVCILSVPTGSYRSVTNVWVFLFAAFWSLWAYVWVAVVYLWWTPDVVTLAEAFLTLAQFFIVAFGNWVVDQQVWNGKYKLIDPEVMADLDRQLTPMEAIPVIKVAEGKPTLHKNTPSQLQLSVAKVMPVPAPDEGKSTPLRGPSNGSIKAAPDGTDGAAAPAPAVAAATINTTPPRPSSQPVSLDLEDEAPATPASLVPLASGKMLNKPGSIQETVRQAFAANQESGGFTAVIVAPKSMRESMRSSNGVAVALDEGHAVNMLPSDHVTFFNDGAEVAKRGSVITGKMDGWSTRHETVRFLTGRPPMRQSESSGQGGGSTMMSAVSSMNGRMNSVNTRPGSALTSLGPVSANTQVVEFKSKSYSVIIAAGGITVHVVRSGPDLSNVLVVQYATEAGTAVEGVNYEKAQDQLIFYPGETMKEVYVKLLDDGVTVHDVSFFITLKAVGPDCRVAQERVEVTLIDEKDKGVLAFPLPNFELPCVEGIVRIPVRRFRGASGTVSVGYVTADDTAQAGKDYTAVHGTLVFANNETNHVIEVPVNKTMVQGIHKQFIMKLEDPSSDDLLGKRVQCHVAAVNPSDTAGPDDNVAPGVSLIPIGGSKPEHWFIQNLKEAILPQPRDENNNFLEPSILFYVLHCINIPWKVWMSPIPPPYVGRGYPAFGLAIAYLAGISFLLEQISTLFGCAVGLNQLMTGIAIVAVGSSLPDTFASIMIAARFKTADPMFGNTFGGNSCNVFIGLGVPWMLSAGYAAGKGEPYLAPAGGVGISVVLFVAVGIITVAVLLIKRRIFGGELGGSLIEKIVFAGILFGLLFLYLVLSGLNSYGNINIAIH